MRFSTLAALLLLAVSATQSSAAQIPVASYSHSGSDGGFYSDSTGLELTDGVDANIAWGPGVPIGVGDIGPLVGWYITSPTIQFNFAGTVEIGALEVWFADSNGSAGVAMPSAVTLSTSGGYSQSFPIVDPPGYGVTVPVTISGLNISTNNLTLTASATQTWSMLSEVRFFARDVPEPAGLMLSVVSILAATMWRSRT
jgi:hypothetical protein